MLLQNESTDEDLEHFEDIVEETDDQTGTKLDKPNNDTESVPVGDSNSADDDSSQEEGVSTSSDSESDVSDEADDLLFGDALEDDVETKPIPDQSRRKPQVSDVRSSLPGGYNPRHREPSFWYFHFLGIAFEHACFKIGALLDLYTQHWLMF